MRSVVEAMIPAREGRPEKPGRLLEIHANLYIEGGGGGVGGGGGGGGGRPSQKGHHHFGPKGSPGFKDVGTKFQKPRIRASRRHQTVFIGLARERWHEGLAKRDPKQFAHKLGF